MPRPRSALLVLAFSAALAAGADPDAINKRKAAHRPRMSYLDNGTIKLGVDLNLGGAITYLAPSGTDDNVVNNWDWGRQIQMSHYAGPAPFRVPGKTPAKAWADFPWNPVQAGDHFGHPSKLLDTTTDGKEYRAWLTRRLVGGLLPLLYRGLAAQPSIQRQANPLAQAELLRFERERAVAASDFTTPSSGERSPRRSCEV